MNRLAKLKGFFYKYPPVALELSQRWAGLVKMRRNKKRLEITHYDIRQIPEGIVPISLNESGGLNIEEMRLIVYSLLKESSLSLKRLSLVIPDNLACIMILNDLTKIPRSSNELLELIKWKIEKKLPFRLQEAMIDFQLIDVPARKGLLVLAVPSRIIRRFEELFSALDIHVGLILPSSFAISNFYHQLLCRNGGSGDICFINMSEYYISFFIFQGKRPRLFRTKNFMRMDREEISSFSPLIDQARLTLLYYQDHMKKEEELTFYLGGIHPKLHEFKSLLEKELNMKIEIISPFACSQIDVVSNEKKEMLYYLASTFGAALGF